MKYIILLTLLLVAPVGCTTVTMHNNDMNSMPCHKMADGSMMGDCDDEQVGSMDMQNMMMNTHQGLLAGDMTNQNNFDDVKSTTIVDVKDGETYTISADIVNKEINGKIFTMYGYNGMIPGPALRVKQGSTINVVFENNIDMNTTVHWHGLRHDIEDDGVPGVSQDPVAPGGKHTYELYFPDDGIFWYHPHIREDLQQDSGLAGNMLVIPKEAYNPVNREELLVLDDILVNEEGEMVPFGKEHANFAIMGRYGNLMLTNGETDYTLEVDRGEVVRFYITNVANVRPYNFSIDGVKMKLVGGDLGQFEREEFVDSLVIAPAMRYFVDVLLEEEGEYNLMNINPHKSYTLGKVLVGGKNVDVSHAENFRQEVINEKVSDDIAKFEKYFDKEIDYKLDLTIDMMGMMDAMKNMPCHSMGGIVMGDCTEEERESLEGDHSEEKIEWEDEMNMKASAAMIDWIIEDANSKLQNMDIKMRAEIGDVVKIRLFNDPESMHPMQHPIHMHGQRFLVTEIDGEQVNNKVWTDTVLVPIGSTVDILVDVTNPGEWMMHCHIAEHLEAGMMTSFIVEE